MWQYSYHTYYEPLPHGAGLLLFVLYFAPSMIAILRGHLSRGAIIVLNLVFGWTFIGWIGALIWSLTGNTARNRDFRR